MRARGTRFGGWSKEVALYIEALLGRRPDGLQLLLAHRAEPRGRGRSSAVATPGRHSTWKLRMHLSQQITLPPSPHQLRNQSRKHGCDRWFARFLLPPAAKRPFQRVFEALS